MKTIKTILLSTVTMMATGLLIGCSEDDFEKSIFGLEETGLDKNSYTYALDAYLEDNFLKPYNVQFIYRMEDLGTDMQKDLVPATYEQSKQLAVLCKYMWYDIYKELAGEKDVFLKKYSPRIIHLTGTPGFNSDGTETLGYATNGTKITLQAVNRLDYNLIEGHYGLNNMFFHTMHHEFTHILDQTISHPQAFNVISTGLYNSDWNSTPDEIAVGNGFVTSYASANNTEDWAETVSNYITKNQADWDEMLDIASYDWEQVDFKDDEERDSLTSLYTKALVYPASYNTDSIGRSFRLGSGEYKWVRKSIVRDQVTGKPIKDEDGKIQYLHNKAIDAIAVINQKVDLAREWLKENYQIDLDLLRKTVQERQYMTDENGNLITKTDGNGKITYVNRLTQPDPQNPEQTLMDSLLKTIDAYAVEK